MTLQEYITKHEGLKLKPYKCTSGKLTIGVGRNLDDRGISQDEAEYMLKNDISYFTYEVQKNVSSFDKLSEIRQWVLIDMCFNLGIAGLLTFKNMLKAIADGEFEIAADAILDSVYAKQVGNRAIENAENMLRG